MDKYIEEICRIPLLSEEETNLLIKQLQEGNEKARETLICHNLRIVVKLAHRYQSKINLPIEDLINIGSFGLIKAVDNFNTNKNTKLSTLAYTYIENTFKNYAIFCKVEKRDDSRDISLQTRIHTYENEDYLTLEDVIVDTSISAEDVAFKHAKNEKLKSILEALTPNEKEILYLHYGINGYNQHSTEEIASKLNISKSSIYQRKDKTLKKLRKPRIIRQIEDFLDD